MRRLVDVARKVGRIGGAGCSKACEETCRAYVNKTRNVCSISHA